MIREDLPERSEINILLVELEESAEHFGAGADAARLIKRLLHHIDVVEIKRRALELAVAERSTQTTRDAHILEAFALLYNATLKPGKRS